MAKIRIVGDSSGYVELAAPNAAGNNTLELPSNATKLVGADASNNLNVTGIVTATGGFSGNINSTGISTITTLNATSIVGVTTAGITTAYIGSVNDGPLAGFRNFIINGNMAISQRGTSFTSINTYNLDRYRTFGGPITHTITQQDSIATYSPSRYALRAARNSGATETNELGIAQGIESQNSYALRGKTVTVSFRARCGANFSSASSTLLVRVFTGTGTDENPVSMTSMNADVSQSVTLTTSLQTFSVTGTLSASLTQATVTFSYTATGTAGANDWFEITDVQLEMGNRATPFERRSFGQELALAQRYYEKSYSLGTAPGSITDVGSIYTPRQSSGEANIVGSVFFMVNKRDSPTVTYYNPTTGSTGEARDPDASANRTMGGLQTGHQSSAYFITAVSTAYCRFHYTASIEL